MTALLVMGISLGAAGATFLGGLLALSLRDKLPLVLGFSAGAVIAVAFFDLLPEALVVPQTAFSTRAIVAVAALGFFAYVLMDRLLTGPRGQADPRRGIVGATSLSAHSVLDGFAIGVAFQAGQDIGLVVASAVLVHDFSDGLNTVNIVSKNGGSRREAMTWLAIDAVAPVAGAAFSLLFTLGHSALALLLAGFSGFFLYIGAADLLPESQRAYPRLWTVFSTLAGAGLLYAVTRLTS